MSSIHDLTTAQLKQALQVREQIESLQGKLSALLGGTASVAKSSADPIKGKRTMSAATKKKMAAAQQARWAKIRGVDAPAKVAPKTAAAPKRKGGLTQEGRARLAAAMKARWAARKKGAAAINASTK